MPVCFGDSSVSDPRGTSLTLLERARANEAGAWDRLVRLYTPLVQHWTRQAGVQTADADDVLQEVFLAASRDLATFRHDRPGDTFRGWLRVITRHSLLAHFRRRDRHPRPVGGSAAFFQLEEVIDPQATGEDDDPPEQVQGLYRRALEMVRAEFEDRTWQMFWLTVVEDREPVQVAQQFGVTPAAVRKAKSRVLHRLKQEVGDCAT